MEIEARQPSGGKSWVAKKARAGADKGKWCGNGQCVTLVKLRAPGLPPTKYWNVGETVQGNMSISVGTIIIATKNGVYWSSGGHAAIYLGQDPILGLLVTDQWITGKGQPVSEHYISWEGHGPNPSYQTQGKNYGVLVTSP